jgi:hypothetical protein
VVRCTGDEEEDSSVDTTTKNRINTTTLGRCITTRSMVWLSLVCRRKPVTHTWNKFYSTRKLEAFAHTPMRNHIPFSSVVC